MRLAIPGSVIATAALVAAANAQSPRTSEWPSYGNDAGGTRFSAASQITPANVKGLRLAWVARTGDLLADRGRFEATPLLVRGTL
jgi:quinoprotein glucose dehydrogenase